MKTYENIKRELYHVLKACNETAIKCNNVDPEQLALEVKKRLKAKKIITVPLTLSEEEMNAKGIQLADRALMTNICMEGIIEKMKAYGGWLAVADKLKCSALCNPNKANSNELDGYLKLLKDVAKGDSNDTDMESLSGYIAGINSKKFRCFIGIITEWAIKIDVMLGIILVLKVLGLV